MRLARSILLALAGGLTLTSGSRAADIALAGNPYAVVVARNIFDLNPPPPPVDPSAADAKPPPKITPNGIMTILGQLQVLFKVADPGAKGKPATDTDYILSEGQRQDDIEVVKIDEKGSLVTFNNHGTVQELPLALATGTTTAAPAKGGPTFNHLPLPGGGHGFGAAGSAGSFGGAFGRHTRTGANADGSNANGANDGPGFGNTPIQSSINNAANQIPKGMTPETQVIMIEANRELTKQQVIDGDMPPLPPTELTPDDATGLDGGPLITPPTGGTPP